MDSYPYTYWLDKDNIKDLLERYPHTRPFFVAYQQGLLSYASMLCLIVEMMYNYSLAQDIIMNQRLQPLPN
jgi:hypothetical protein